LDNVWIYCGYLLMGAIAGAVLFRGVQTGVLHGEDVSYDRDAQPLGYAIQLTVLIVIVVVCVLGMAHAVGIAPDPMAILRGRAFA